MKKFICFIAWLTYFSLYLSLAFAGSSRLVDSQNRIHALPQISAASSGEVKTDVQIAPAWEDFVAQLENLQEQQRKEREQEFNKRWPERNPNVKVYWETEYPLSHVTTRTVPRPKRRLVER